MEGQPKEPLQGSDKRSHAACNGTIGAACGCVFVVVGAVLSVVIAKGGNALFLLVDPVIIAVIGLSVAGVIAGTKAFRGFAPGFLIGLGVTLLVVCGTCFAFFANLKP